MSFNILVVEDEKNISDVIIAYLEQENYTSFFADDGEKALDIFNKEDIHLVILDLMIPTISGEEVCKTIRKTSNVPIIMLTAKVEEDDRIGGFTLGADDYVTKPFSPRELMVRVKALLRRTYSSKETKNNLISFNDGDLTINKESMIAKKEGKSLDMTTNEFKVLNSLIDNKNQVLSRKQLIELSFGYEYDGYDRTVDTYIKNIRQKIEDDPSNPNYIKTVYGAGYRFDYSD